MPRLEEAITTAVAAGVEDSAVQAAQSVAAEQRRLVEQAVARLSELEGAVARIDVAALKAAIAAAQRAGVDAADVQAAGQTLQVAEGPQGDSNTCLALSPR